MNEAESARWMWDSTARRHYDRAMTNLQDVHKEIGYLLSALNEIDPTNLDRRLPGGSDVRNWIGQLVEASQRLEMLDLLRDFAPVYRPGNDKTEETT